MTIAILAHTDFDAQGSLRHAFDPERVRLYHPNGDDAQEVSQLNPAELDGLILLTSIKDDVNDEQPWLAAERILIRSLEKLDRPVLGFGFGAQQIVRAFGANVIAMSRPTLDFQTFNEPDGTQLSAWQWQRAAMMRLPGSTPQYVTQIGDIAGFAYHDNLVGFQFDPEADRQWLDNVAQAVQMPVPDGDPTSFEAANVQLALTLSALFD